MEIVGFTVGEIETPMLSDGSDFFTPLVDTSGCVIGLIGWDGSKYVPLKTNSSGQLEVEVKGSA